MQVIEWPNMDGSVTFEHMDRLKGDMLDDGTSDDTWVRESEVRERVERAVKEARTDARDEWIRALKETGMSGSDIAALPPVDVKAARVNQIARGE
jgi:hypothetical protein